MAGCEARSPAWRAVHGAVLTLVAATALAGCSSSDDSGDTGSSDTSKYTQTWPKSYSATTCREWNNDMTDAQQWAAAADMLTGARNKGDGGQGVPPDSLVNEFQDGITTACAVPSLSLAETGASLYLTERARFQP